VALTLTHALRIACAGLSGVERETAMIYYMRNPLALREQTSRVIKMQLRRKYRKTA
jgi:hypothetical protein